MVNVANTTVPDFYTWLEFKTEVLNLMPQDADRLGMDNYLPRLIREAVIDLQQFIPAYRKRHETLYYAKDLVDDGAASAGQARGSRNRAKPANPKTRASVK